MTGSTWKAIRRTVFAAALIAAPALGANPALAADPITTPPAATSTASTAAAGTTDSMRLIQGFFTDAAIANQWWEGQIRYQSGAFPPIQDADGMRIGGVLAINVFKNVELGGRVAFGDYDLDNPVNRGGDSFDGESGATDMDVFAKWRVMDGDIKVAVGGSLTLPTGSEDDGLGTGEVVPAVFGAVRGDLSSGNRGTFTGVAHLGFRVNKDAEIFNQDFDAKTSVFLGAGVLVKLTNTFGWTAELNVETERFEGFDSDIRLTGGAHWDVSKHQTLRGGVGFGLADGAPDFELIGSYVYHF